MQYQLSDRSGAIHRIQRERRRGSDINGSTTRILGAVTEFLLLTASTAVVPLIVYVDSVVLCDGVTEYSITEIAQETLLLLSAVLFFVAAWRRPRSRGFLILVGGLLACMLIRELDFLFDFVQHGFWLYPAVLTAIGCVAVAAVHRDTILTPMVRYTRSKSWIYVTIGLLVVLVLSRLFGSGRLIWNAVMCANYKAEHKAIIQEGLELFGYIFVFYGACLVPKHQH